jgi:hypothetical protein
MNGDDRRYGQPDPVDPLALAEAVAAGRLGFAAAEAALWEARPDDPGRAANEVAELRDLVAAIRGVRRHAEAVRQAGVEVFDPDAASVPLGSGRSADDDRGIAPRRVQGGDVRLRPSARPRQRWAPVGALAAAAVLVVAVALVVPGLLAPSVATTPAPTSGPSGVVIATPSASVAPSPTSSTTSGPTAPPPTSAATGVKGVPAIASQPLAGAPGIAYWTLSAVGQITITEWRPDGSPARFRLTASTTHDPDLAKGDIVDRRVVVSPDGSRVVFAESTTTSTRTRVFATDGTLLWTDQQPTFQPDIAWSADGSRLVIGSQPATWKILTFKASGGAPTVDARDFTRDIPDAAWRVLGFSTSGAILYGWNTQGEADWWQTPFHITVGDKPVTVARFSGQAAPLAISNGTTPTSNVAPEEGSTTQVAGVDPKTYRMLDTGDLSGRLNGWEVRDSSAGDGTKLTGLGMDMALAWTGDGAIVVADVTHADRPATITTTLTENLGHRSPTFSVPAGDYWRLFEGSRGGFALLGLAAARTGALWLGADELVAVELSTARSAVLVPTDPGLTGVHPAGWITAP